MAGWGNYKKRKGPPPIHGIHSVPCPGEKKEVGGKYPYIHFSNEIADEICDRLAMGQCFAQIEMIVGMPSRRSIDNWRNADPEFDKAVLRAMEIGDDRIAHEIKMIADTPLMCEKTELDESGKVVKTIRYDNTDRSRQMIDARKWGLAVRNRRYAENVHHNISNKDGEQFLVRVLDTAQESINKRIEAASGVGDVIIDAELIN